MQEECGIIGRKELIPFLEYREFYRKAGGQEKFHVYTFFCSHFRNLSRLGKIIGLFLNWCMLLSCWHITMPWQVLCLVVALIQREIRIHLMESDL